jgi:hypothetical protein
MINKLLLLFLTLFIKTGVYCQMLDSVATYNDALELYNQGRYDEAEKLFKRKHVFYNLINEQNWKILEVQTFIEEKKLSEANKVILQLVKSDPNYLPIEGIYQEDFYTLVKNISVHPTITLGAKAALSFPIYKVAKVQTVYDSTNYDSPYKKINGYCYSIYLQGNIAHNFAFVLDYSYAKSGYKRKITRDGVDNFELKYSEVIYSNELGISLKKYLLKDDSKLFVGPRSPILHKGSGPYLSIGGYYSKMRQAQANAELNYLYIERQNQYTEPKNITRNNIDVKDMRNKNRFGISGAIGSSLTIDRFVISLEGKYLYDLTELTNPEKRYANNELLFNYYYIDNDVSMSRIDVSLSLAYILSYKVKSKIK